MISDAVLGRLEALESEFRTCEAQLADPAVVADQTRYVEMSKRYRQLAQVVETLQAWRDARDDVAAARELLGDASGDDDAALRDEVTDGSETIERLEEELRALLLPPDPFDGRNVIVEIRGAEGGEEANLFARDLFEMYRALAGRHGWSFETLSSSPSDLGGFSEVVLRIAGDGVWPRLKFEAGPHRVQRVPVTESQGRIHTSSATVVVLPEADEVEVHIDVDKDLQITKAASGGKGGQGVNTTNSAVQIVHLPTRMIVKCQDERSQIKNLARAMKVLRSRLLDIEQKKQAASITSDRRAMVGTGERAEKVRTYNFPQNRVSDHRIQLTLYKLDRFINGDLDEVLTPLRTHHQAERLRRELGIETGLNAGGGAGDDD